MKEVNLCPSYLGEKNQKSSSEQVMLTWPCSLISLLRNRALPTFPFSFSYAQMLEIVKVADLPGDRRPKCSSEPLGTTVPSNERKGESCCSWKASHNGVCYFKFVI